MVIISLNETKLFELYSGTFMSYSSTLDKAHLKFTSVDEIFVCRTDSG